MIPNGSARGPASRRSPVRWLTSVIVGIGFLPLAAVATVPAAASTTANSPNKAFCSRLGHSIQASSGAQAYCFGIRRTTPSSRASIRAGGGPVPLGPNVNAANPAEDRSAAGVQAYGQSETSIAANGNYVVESWNDSTGFFSNCPSPMNKEELTGYGFSANGGASFVDEGGLPNKTCQNYRLSGDPSVETWTSGNTAWFYISSLYVNVGPPPPPGAPGNPNYLALNACKATGTGVAAVLACSQPIILARSTNCTAFPAGTNFCSFLDKEFLTIDPKRGRLYTSYDEFDVAPFGNGKVELAVCDIGTPAGGVGPAGGTAGAPKCFPGSTGMKPYSLLAPNGPCENEGAYPAVDLANGDVYVAYEYNWATNLFSFACASIPTANKLARVPFSCLTLTPTSPCTTLPVTRSTNIVSMDAAFVPGYNRFPMNDFPRIAVSDPAGTVSMVWNDARLHPTGDILLQSFSLGAMVATPKQPIALNDDQTFTWKVLPALRYPDRLGKISVTWYDRRGQTGANTNVWGVLGLDPKSAATKPNSLVTDVPSDWNAVSSDIIPNFGDYTDNYIQVTAANAATNQIYPAWSDGRIGEPQPFTTHGPTEPIP